MNARLSVLALSSVLLLAPGLRAQEDQPTAKYQVLSLAEIQITTYEAQHVSPKDLYRTVSDLVGRRIWVEEKGSGARPIEDLALVGDAIMIFDTQEYVQKVLATLAALDVPEAAKSQRPNVEDGLVTIQYRPRHLSPEALRQAAETFGVFSSSFAGSQALVVRVDREQEAALHALLAEVDVPADRVAISCYLLAGRSGPSEAPADGVKAPEELVRHLKTLLPQFEFQTLGFSMLQSSVTLGRGVGLTVETAVDGRFSLEFEPVAYDRESGDLSVVGCGVVRSRSTIDAKMQSRTESSQLLRTDTVFRGGEYTVLGASGVSPVFVVIKLDRIP